MEPYLKLTEIFLKANKKLFASDNYLFETNISERCLCGRLMLYLNEQIKHSEFKEYYVDVEYNRNGNGLKTYINEKYEAVTIICDVIIHSRGEIIEQDNLLAFEMKKSTAPEREKQKDRDRLRALTRRTFDSIWSLDGTSFPEHVCGYILGIYYEIDFRNSKIEIEYYRDGEKTNYEVLGF